MDLSRLRDAALQNGEDEEAVTVDTRALIDKVLARYSGEWTTLRELIQNAADAHATTVTVKWESLPSTQTPLPPGASTSRSELLKHIIEHHTCRRLLVQNDGQPFTATDWHRLKRIAEGNPDETKIGAFGVGFYSVFADCEEPFVSSGSEAMAFYWKGNALFTKKLKLPPSEGTKDTVFLLDYRNTTTALPNLLSVTQFLATSLTFVGLEKLEFWIDDFRILSLRKKNSPPLEIPIPSGMEIRTQEKLLSITGACRVNTQIDACAARAIGWKPAAAATSKASEQFSNYKTNMSLKSFFSRLGSSHSAQVAQERAIREEQNTRAILAEDVTKTDDSTIFLHTTTASIKSHVSGNFSAELERATKKPPPKTTKLSILTSSYDETVVTESLGASNRSDTDVFATILPSKKPGGRIFIGFPTMQTTGGGMHISAPSVIPTVEREAIDLNARWVRTWNMEILRCAGKVVHLAFGVEMAVFKSKVQNASKGVTPTPAMVQSFLPEALHILKTYAFADSTPNQNVGRIVEEAFWMTFTRPSIDVFSTAGVLPTSEVRIQDEELAKFVDGIPVVPKALESSPFISKLREFGLLANVRPEDLRRELERKALNKDQLVNFISWAAQKSRSGELDPPSRADLMQVVVANFDDEDGEKIIELRGITNYIVMGKIPHTMPLPPSTLPFSLTSFCKTQDLEVLGWTPLDVLPWLRYILESCRTAVAGKNVKKDAAFAISVLTVLSKQWGATSAHNQATIVSMLENNTVIPTTAGMKRPSEAYFPNVKLFENLPILDAACSGLKQEFLSAIGVRKTIELDAIFGRLFDKTDNGGGWSHVDVIKYLASVQSDIPKADMKRLKQARICAAEAGPPGHEWEKGSTQLYRIDELFEPLSGLRELGLRCLMWPEAGGKYWAQNSEGKFLLALGLRSYPTVAELVGMMTGSDVALREKALLYFQANYFTNSYNAVELVRVDKPILPVEGDPKRLVRPADCYTNSLCAVLGFDILRSDLQQHANKFGVARDPKIVLCMRSLLERRPESVSKAKLMFEYLSSRAHDIATLDMRQVSQTTFIPIVRKGPEKRSTTSYISPLQCYLGSSSSSTYGDIFDFVDFGSAANAFLLQCGAKWEPSNAEIAALACNEPSRLLGVLESPTKYLSLLTKLANDAGNLRQNKTLWHKMMSAPFLLALKDSPKLRKLLDSDNDAMDDDLPTRQYHLASASSIIINDDFTSFRMFRDAILCAPEDDILETFYLALGAQPLSKLIQEDVRVGSQLDNQKEMASLHKLIIERTRLFLHEACKGNANLIRHDAQWLDDHLDVVGVRSIKTRRTLQGTSMCISGQKYAASKSTGNKWILYIAADHEPNMFQICQAISPIILKKPTPEASNYMETFLKLSLYQLKDRGFNVDRILRAHAAEARIAEEEKRKAQEAQERRNIEAQVERAKLAAEAQATAVVATGTRDGDDSGAMIKAQRPSSPPPPMPGTFEPDSPQGTMVKSGQHAPESSGTGGLLDHLSKTLGFKSSEDVQQQLSRFLTGGGSSEPAGNNIISKPISTITNRQRVKEQDDGRVTNPAVVQNNLLSAIHASRPYSSSELYSPPRHEEVKEGSTYCDNTAAHDLVHRGMASNNMAVFVDRDMHQDVAANYLRSNIKAINVFADLLMSVCDIYKLAPSAMHLFYDEKGATIAFNSNGSIFCNLRYFMQLHYGHISDASQASVGTANALSYWYVVLAHELAHNLESAHNSHHSFISESFIQMYWLSLTTVLMQLVGPSNTPTNAVPRFLSPSSSRPPPLPLSSSSSSSSSLRALREPPPYSAQPQPQSQPHQKQQPQSSKTSLHPSLPIRGPSTPSPSSLSSSSSSLSAAAAAVKAAPPAKWHVFR